MYERGENLKNWTSSPPAPPLALPSNECVTQLPAAESLSIYTHTRACTHRRVNIILETLFFHKEQHSIRHFWMSPFVCVLPLSGCLCVGGYRFFTKSNFSCCCGLVIDDVAYGEKPRGMRKKRRNDWRIWPCVYIY